jgi:hypothetical protein
MFGAIWEWVAGLFTGKATTQIGSRNLSVAGVTVGDYAGPVTVGNHVHIHNSPVDTARSEFVEIDPTPAEIEILCRLARSSDGILHKAPTDGGFDVLIDGDFLSGVYGGQYSAQLRDGVDRLTECRLLTEDKSDDRIRHLSSGGRRMALRLEKQLDSGDHGS